MSTEPKTAFTPEEAEISRLIVEAHKMFAQLEKQHPDEGREWCDAIHHLQNVLGWRVLRREFPFDFPIVTEIGSHPVLEYAYPDLEITLKDSDGAGYDPVKLGRDFDALPENMQWEFLLLIRDKSKITLFPDSDDLCISFEESGLMHRFKAFHTNPDGDFHLWEALGFKIAQ